jgi:hypothetical protein
MGSLCSSLLMGEDQLYTEEALARRLEAIERARFYLGDRYLGDQYRDYAPRAAYHAQPAAPFAPMRRIMTPGDYVFLESNGLLAESVKLRKQRRACMLRYIVWLRETTVRSIVRSAQGSHLGSASDVLVLRARVEWDLAVITGAVLLDGLKVTNWIDISARLNRIFAIAFPVPPLVEIPVA